MPINKLPTLALESNAITADLIASGAITAADISDGEITAAKLHTTLDFSTKTFTMHNNHVTQAMVTQHQAALSITESQVSDLQSYVLPNTSPTFTNTTLTGYLAGPATFTIDPAAVGDNTGTVVIAGNLQVDGTTTTINSTTVEIDDLNLTLASGAANAAAANGAGITVDGSNATITYDASNDEWDFNKDINVTGNSKVSNHSIVPTIYGGVTALPTLTLQNTNGNSNHSKILVGNQIASDNGGISLYTAGSSVATERVRISGTSGNVGIGTNSPAGKFHVVGSGGVTGGTPQNSGSGNQIVIENNASGGSADIQLLGPTNGYNHIFFGDADDANIGVIYYNHINNSLNFTTNANTGVMIFTSDGNIGIGTNSPAYTIDVHKNATGNTDVMRLKGYAGNAFVRFQDSDNSSDWTFGADDNSGLGSNALIAYDRLNTAYRWALDSAGNLYIGTTSPTSHKVNIRSDQANNIVINAVNAYAGSGTSTMLNLTNNTDTDIQFVINEVGAATKYASIGPSVTGRALVLGAPNGNVGIGQTNPDARLDLGTLNSATAGQDQTLQMGAFGFRHQDTGGFNHLYLERNYGGWQATPVLTARADGNVGIGTSTPATALHVDPGYVTLGGSGGTDNSWINNVENGNLELVNEGRSTNDGAVRINRKNNPAGDTTYFRDTVIYDGKSNVVLFVDGSENKVGIGTSTPDTILEIVSSNPILTLRDTGTGFNNGDATLRLAESGPGDTLGGYFDVRLDASMLKFDFTPEGGSASTYMAINSSDGNVGIGTTSPAGYFHIAGNGTTNDRMFNISTTGIGGGQNGVFYGGKVQVQANNSAIENFGWHVFTDHAGIYSPTTSIHGEAKTGSSNVRVLGVHGIADSNSAAVNYGPNTANAQGVAAGVYAEAKTYNSTNNATISALIAQNRASAANTAYGAWINTTPGPTSIIPLSVNHNGTEKFTVNALADAMVHVKGDPADTGTTGGSDGLSIAYDGGRSCPIYFGAETNSAQKSMYMTGYWIYLRGHQNEGIRFVFSQGAGSAPRSDQYQFKYNSATRPTGNTTWDGFSDVRAKENVQNITGALDTISQLRPVVFDWTDDYADTMNMFKMDETDPKSYNWTSVKENGYDLTKKNGKIGFIAQEFEKIFPKDITELEVQLGDEKVEDFKTVNYDSLIPTLTKAIQELKAENDALKARLDAAGL